MKKNNEAPEGIDTTYLDTRDKKHTRRSHSTKYICIAQTKETIKSQSKHIIKQHLRCFYPSSLNLKHNGYLIRPPALLHTKID
jgi:hypothetical protein